MDEQAPPKRHGRTCYTIDGLRAFAREQGGLVRSDTCGNTHRRHATPPGAGSRGAPDCDPRGSSFTPGRTYRAVVRLLGSSAK